MKKPIMLLKFEEFTKDGNFRFREFLTGRYLTIESFEQGILKINKSSFQSLSDVVKFMKLAFIEIESVTKELCLFVTANDEQMELKKVLIQFENKQIEFNQNTSENDVLRQISQRIK